MAVSKYEYPRLSRAETVTLLSRSQIATVTEQDLINCNPDLISDLYTRILIQLDCLPEDDNEQLDFDSLELIENPDVHGESVRNIKLYNMIRGVLTALLCPENFTFTDLLTPNPRRTEFFLGAMMNFVLYREQRMNSISGSIDEVSAVEEQRAQLESGISQLESGISDLNEAREREKPLVQELDAKVKELQQTINDLNKQQMSLRTSLRKLKDKDRELDAKISHAEFTLLQSVQENANLRSQIAQSPDKLQRALEEKKLAQEEAKNAARIAMQTFHEKTALVEVYSKVYKKMSKHYKQMQDIQEQVNSGKSIEKELKALKAKLSDEEVLEKSLEAQLVEKQTKVGQMEELRKKIEKECNTMREEATKYLNSKKSEVESKKSALETWRRNIEAVLTKVDTINSQIISAKENEAATVEQIRHKSEKLVEEFRNFKNSFEHITREYGAKLEDIDLTFDTPR